MDFIRSVFSRFRCFSRVTTYTAVEKFYPEEYPDEIIRRLIPDECVFISMKDIPNDIIVAILNTHLPEFEMSLAEKIIEEAISHGCIDVLEYIKSVRGFRNLRKRDYYWDSFDSNNIKMMMYLHRNGFSWYA